MLRNIRLLQSPRISYSSIYVQRQSFLTNDYKCTDGWKEQTASPLLNKINLNDFYNKIDINHSSKGVISAIDVDIFANAVKDPIHLDELRDLLHRLRLSAETGNMLESTHYATVRNYLEHGNIEDLLCILKDPLNYGLFLDNYTANILLDKLITSSEFEQAAHVSGLIMLQEDYNNEITCALCLYACFKYLIGYSRPVAPVIKDEKNKKVEEIKIRVKFLRNPYFDDHFDIKDTSLLAGKTLAWMSERYNDNLSHNLQIIGWLAYKKYNKLLSACENLGAKSSSVVYNEVIDLMNKEIDNVEEDTKTILKNCVSKLKQINLAKEPIEESIKTMIENSINKIQNNDINKQLEVWTEVRKQKLDEQTKRLDRAKRLEFVDKKQTLLQTEEQKLWFFENEDNIDLQIEEKEKNVEKSTSKKTVSKKVDEDYIPPEILPQRRR